MPVKPEPRIHVCTACGWNKAVSPRSDAFQPGELVDSCPSCGNTILERRKVDFFDLIANFMFKRK